MSLQGQLYCGICKGERVLDVRSGTEQDLLRLAGAGRRFAALTLDRLIMAMGVGIMVALTVGLSSTLKVSSDASGTYIFVVLAVGILGFVALEAVLLTRRGQTLGKMAASIKVVRPDGSAIHAGQAWGRTIARLMAVHVLALADYIPALVTKEKTCLHDLLANTRVVSVD
jgi:uncharacterized RDD family membrane protein YckC